jgi:molecular chaperone GrpE
MVKEDKDLEETVNTGILEDSATEISEEDLEVLEEATVSPEDELQELKEKLLRAQAEVQNVRRIAAQEVTKARLYGVESLAREFLSVGDNLERALDSCSEESGVVLIREGLELTLKGFEGSLATAGISSINPKNESFDPDRHEALSLIEDNSKEDNTIIEVIQTGYMIQDRVLRPAKVIVSRKPKIN